MKQFLIMVLIISTSIGVICPQKTIAQTLRGIVFQVIDQKDSAVVVGATLAIGQQQNVTDAWGYANLSVEASDKIHIHGQAMGYKSLDMDIKLMGRDTIQLLLEPDYTTLDAIEIANHKIVLNTTNALSTLQQKDLVRLQGNNLATILSNINGVTQMQTGATIGKPVVNGMHSNRLLILNNGVRQEGQQWGAEHAPEIDPYVAQTLTVVKGAEAIRYGAEAIGGVVIIEPAPLPQDSSIHAEVNVVGASNGRGLTTAAMLSGHHKAIPNWSWRAQGSYKKTGNIQTPTYYLENTGSREMNYSFQSAYNREHFQIGAYYSLFHTNLGIFSGAHIGNMSDLQAAINRGRPLTEGSFSYDINAPKQEVWHHLIKLNAHFHLNDYWHAAIVYGLQLDNRKEFDIRRGGRTSLPSLNLNLNTHTLNALVDYFNGRRWKTTLGIDAMLQENKYDGTTATRQLIPDYNAQSVGAYALSKWSFSRFQLEAGLRYDYKYLTALGYRNGVLFGNRHHFHNVSGSIGVAVPWRGIGDFKSNIATAWRPPSINELYSSGLHHGAAAIEYGDSTLKAEQSVKWMNSFDAIPCSWLKLSVELYAHYFHGYIYLSPTGTYEQGLNGAFPVFQTLQTNARFLGADVMVFVQPWKAWQYNIKAAFIQAKDISNNAYLPMIPTTRITQGITWKPTVNIKGIQEPYIALEHLWVDKQHHYTIGSDFAPPPNAYQLWNVNMGTAFKIGKQALGIHLSIMNLTNTVYKDYMNRFRYYANDMGRNIMLRLHYKF
jgi:iron complex outermembrane receptor protein